MDSRNGAIVIRGSNRRVVIESEGARIDSNGTLEEDFLFTSSHQSKVRKRESDEKGREESSHQSKGKTDSSQSLQSKSTSSSYPQLIPKSFPNLASKNIFKEVPKYNGSMPSLSMYSLENINRFPALPIRMPLDITFIDSPIEQQLNSSTPHPPHNPNSEKKSITPSKRTLSQTPIQPIFNQSSATDSTSITPIRIPKSKSGHKSITFMNFTEANAEIINKGVSHSGNIKKKER